VYVVTAYCNLIDITECCDTDGWLHRQ